MKTEYIRIDHSTLRHDAWGFPCIDWTGDQGSSGEFRLSADRAADLDKVDVEAGAREEIDAMNAAPTGGDPDRHHYLLA